MMTRGKIEKRVFTFAVGYTHNAVDQVEKQLCAHCLDTGRQALVVQVSGVNVDCLGKLRRCEIRTHMVHQVSEHTVRERSQCLVRGDSCADQDFFVQQNVDFGHKCLSEVD